MLLIADLLHLCFTETSMAETILEKVFINILLSGHLIISCKLGKLKYYLICMLVHFFVRLPCINYLVGPVRSKCKIGSIQPFFFLTCAM